MNKDYITETSPLAALDEIFKNSPKKSPIKLISCSDKYGDMLITETQKIFIPFSNDYRQKAYIQQLKDLFNKHRRSKNITVGGLKRYSDYTLKKWLEECKRNGDISIDKTSNTNNSNDGIDKGNTYDLTDDGTGKKYDSGKSMVGTLCRVFPRALLGIGKCIEFGTHKYPKPDNWKLVENAFTRYQDSLMRHYLKFLSGETRDKETNILHLCHMAWNTLAILELYLMEHKEEFDKELFK